MRGCDDQERVQGETGTVVEQGKVYLALLLAGGLAFGGLLAWLLGNGISRPMLAMCAAMRKLAAGDFDVVLPGLGRKDEIGDMAGAVEEFKMQAVAKADREAEERGRGSGGEPGTPCRNDRLPPRSGVVAACHRLVVSS